MLFIPVLEQWVPVLTLPVPQWPAETTTTRLSSIDASRGESDRRPAITGTEAAPAIAAPTTEPRLFENELPGSDTARLRGAGWSTVLAALYGLGVVTLLARSFFGWRAARRLTRCSQLIALSVGDEVFDEPLAPTFESTFVATPVTVGVIAPVIVLPAGWRSWPAWNLQAVLAHERAHVRRRDPLVNFIARLNCCVFWFHPLSWWLQRELNISAEQASDEEAVREVGEAERYSLILIEMARAVRAQGGRLAWQGIGMDGSGLLGQRIDRILRGPAFKEMSRARKVLLAAGCALAVLVVAACQRQAPVTPLREDPQVAKRLADQKALQDRHANAEAMTATEVDQLEASLKINPEDLAALEKLKIFYQRSGQKVFGWNEMIARRRPHVLWLIQHHPDQDLAVWKMAPAGDPAGYAEAKKAWLAQTNKKDVPPLVLGNAARFLEVHDPQLAEQMLLRAKGLEPNDAKWSIRLGVFYAGVIIGPRSPRDGSPLTPLDGDQYARQIRLQVAESRDDALLSAAGSELVLTYNDPDRGEVGQRLLEKALQINPQSPRTALRLAAAQERSRVNRTTAIIRTKQAQLAGREIARRLGAGERLTEEEGLRLRSLALDAVMTAPIAEGDRLLALVDLADMAYMMGEARAFTNNDEEGANAYFARSKKAAQNALELASKFRASPDYGVVLYRGTIALATHALREGDRKTAVRLMLDAGNAPPSERFAEQYFSLDTRLLNYLLK
jgi:hypothetical protein